MNRRCRKAFLKSMRVKAHVAVAMPPSEFQMVKEYKIGRNDKCPCEKNTDAEHWFADWANKMVLWGPKKGEECPEYKELKYKDCCLKSGKYENYKTIK